MLNRLTISDNLPHCELSITSENPGNYITWPSWETELHPKTLLGATLEFRHSFRKITKCKTRTPPQPMQNLLINLKDTFFRHGRRTAPKFGSQVRTDTRLALTKKIDPTHPRGGYLCVWVATMMWDDVVLWDVCGFFRHDRRTAPKFCTHVRIDTLTLNLFDSPHPRGLSIVKNLSRRTAPKFGTHVRIDTLTLKKS